MRGDTDPGRDRDREGDDEANDESARESQSDARGRTGAGHERGGGDGLQAEYGGIENLTDRLRFVAESLSVSFDRWEERYVSGPSLYFVVVADIDLGDYVDPLGGNRWPVERCRVATDDLEPFVDAARQVAFKRDGAVVVTADGTIQEQMVRVRSPSEAAVERHEDIEYADWMGTKHLSAVEASAREEVLVAVTVSEETGRVSVFHDGTVRSDTREELGGRWRPRRRRPD